MVTTIYRKYSKGFHFRESSTHKINNKDKNKPTLKASVISAFFLSSSIDLSSHTFWSPEMKKYH